MNDVSLATATPAAVAVAAHASAPIAEAKVAPKEPSSTTVVNTISPYAIMIVDSLTLPPSTIMQRICKIQGI